MEAAVTPEQSPEKAKGWGWLIGLLAFFVLYWILGLVDTSTEITPSHDRVMNVCFLLAGLGGLLGACLVFVFWRGVPWWKRAYVAVLLAVAGFIFSFLLISRIATLTENAIDFPAGRTQTKRGVLIIWRAYRTHGKGGIWNIQTTPVWSNLDVTRADYDFVLAHRPPDGIGRDGDEIHSHGYFCADVSVQTSGPAVRVLHAGSEKLPQGTIIICPARLGS